MVESLPLLDMSFIDYVHHFGDFLVAELSENFYSHSSADNTCDLPIDPDNENQFIVWAVGGLGVTAFKHFTRADCKNNINSCSGDGGDGGSGSHDVGKVGGSDSYT